MTLNQRLTLLLLLGLTFTSGAASSLCTLSKDMTRCVCSMMVFQSPLDSQICAQASEVELRDGNLVGFQMSIIRINPALLKKLIFNRVTVPFSFVSAVLPFLSLTNLNEINIISSTLEVVQPTWPRVLPGASNIKALRLEDITVDSSVLQPSFKALHHWLFSSLESLGLVRSGLVEIDCYWAHIVQSVTHLDLSENPISYTSLQTISHCSSLSFKSLKTLHLRRSNLTSLQPLCTPLSLTPALTQLDVSWNNFSIFHYPHCLRMKPFRMLNLSHSGIIEVNSLVSVSLEELDLSYNSLIVFSNPPQNLKKLYLSNNRFIRLPSLDNLKQLDVLHAGRNPYECDCALKDTIIFLDNTNSVSVEDYPEDFLCATPAALQGTQIKSLSLEACLKPTDGTHDHSSPLYSTVSSSGTQDHGSPLYSTVSSSGTQDHGSPLYSTVSSSGTQDHGSPLYSTVSSSGTQDHGSPLYSTVSSSRTQDHGSPLYSTVSSRGTQDHGSPLYSTVSSSGTQDHGSPLYSTVSSSGTQDHGSPLYSTVSSSGTQDHGSPLSSTVSSRGTQDQNFPLYLTLFIGLLSHLI